MKNLFSICLSLLMLISVSFRPVFAQEDTATEDITTTGEVVDDTTTTTEDTTTDTEDPTTTEEDTATTTDETSDTIDTTVEETETDTTIGTPTTTTTEDSSGFLDGIDTMWLWVILGVGGIVLVGSLIGIISLAKKEKVGDSIEDIPNIPQPVVNTEPEVVKDIIPTPVEQTALPIQPTQEISPQVLVTPVVENKTEEIPTQPVVEELPSIKETLGDASTYKQPEVNNRVVSNVVPETNVDKDLADLNVVGAQQTIEPQISTIETATVKPEDIAPESPPSSPNADLNNGMSVDLGVSQIAPQKQPISNTSQPQIDNQAMNIMNGGPVPQSSPPLSPMNNPTVNPIEAPQAPIPTPEPITTPSPIDTSTPIPQTQEQTLADENLSNQGLTQPIDTTSL